MRLYVVHRDAKWESLYSSRAALLRKMSEIKTLQKRKLEGGTPVLYTVTVCW